MTETNATRAAGSSAPTCSLNGQCPAKTKRNVMYCSASVRGVCKFGFNAIDRKGQCYRKRSANSPICSTRSDAEGGKAGKEGR